jgi:hypothetical protein
MPEEAATQQEFDVVVQINGITTKEQAKLLLNQLTVWPRNKLVTIVKVQADFEQRIVRARLLVPMALYLDWSRGVKRNKYLHNYAKVLAFKKLAPVPWWLSINETDYPNTIGLGLDPTTLPLPKASQTSFAYNQTFEIVLQINGVQSEWMAKNQIKWLKEEGHNKIIKIKADYASGRLLIKLAIPMRYYKTWALNMRKSLFMYNYAKVLRHTPLEELPDWLILDKVDLPQNIGKGYIPGEVEALLRRQGVKY